MIKASELRIGNYICAGKQADGTDEIGRLVNIQKEAYSDWNGGDLGFTYELKEGDYWSPDEIYPIPLSEEWLLKFGFEKNGSVFGSVKEKKTESYKDIGVTYPDFFFNSRLNRWMDCQTRVCVDHVHQLQNLYFALTGEELTIKD